LQLDNVPSGDLTVYSSAHVAPVELQVPVAVLQLAPPLQSALVTQLVLQAFDVASQVYSPQSTGETVAHLPVPSHCDAGVSESFSHLAAPQAFAAPGNVQPSTFAPSQRPSQSLPAPAHAGRVVPLSVCGDPA
jgi:hypothetical protein